MKKRVAGIAVCLMVSIIVLLPTISMAFGANAHSGLTRYSTVYNNNFKDFFLDDLLMNYYEFPYYYQAKCDTVLVRRCQSFTLYSGL